MNSNEIIDKIQDVRKKNNVNWMNILRLAFECNPTKAKEIMKGVKSCDEEINKLTYELAKYSIEVNQEKSKW